MKPGEPVTLADGTIVELFKDGIVVIETEVFYVEINIETIKQIGELFR